MSINGFVIYFFTLSLVGYIYETIAMTIWGGKFENRGFLLGPIIPIYGAGAVIGTILFEYVWPDANSLEVFITGVIGSAVLEYPTHYILEKVFHQRWWDYTNAPLNLNGRICLPAALGFGIGALIIVRLINPLILPFINSVSEVFADILSLLLVGLFSSDLAFTISIISDFEERVSDLGDRIDDSLENILSKVLNEDKPFKDKAYKVMYAPRNAKEKIKEVPEITKEKVEAVGEVVSNFRKFRKEKYKKVIRSYNKYKEYRKKATSIGKDDER